ncbi:MAG: hypothetical protein DDT37_02001 [Firmicutes bacterium]|nr:hypothetical protein [candidate division NPL-UPA2 bacterium]
MEDNMTEGYLALVVSIIVSCTPEVAFGRLDSSEPKSVKHPTTPDELADMHKLKCSGMTYRELAEMYGLSPYTIYGRLRQRRIR